MMPYCRSWFSNNIVYGINKLMKVGATCEIRDWVFSNNIIKDVRSGTSFTFDPATNLHCIKFLYNTFDLDPYHKDLNRAANGGWTGLGDKTLFLLQGNKGIHITGNTFRNMSRITDIDFSNAHRAGTITGLMNYIEGYPVAFGFNTGNLGVGYVPSAKSISIPRVFIADPTSPQYGDFLNEINATSTLVPTSGYYLSDWTIKDETLEFIDSGANRKVVLGWKRLTTGDQHVIGVDWDELIKDNLIRVE